ncbi:hypothetical protein Tco_0287536 [Tanacetum coccineum]
MRFLMGLDDVFSSVRISILIIDPILDVKYAFATLSRDKSHKNSNVHNFKSSSFSFVSRYNNDWFVNRNNQNMRSNRDPNSSLVFNSKVPGGDSYFGWRSVLLRSGKDLMNPYDIVRDKKSNDDGTSSSEFNTEPQTNPASAESFIDYTASTSDKHVHKNTSFTNKENMETHGSIIIDGDSKVHVATSDDDDSYDSEGEYFTNFNHIFGSDELDLDSLVDEDTVRRSNRRSKLPSRL